MNVLLFLVIITSFAFSKADDKDKCTNFPFHCPSWYSTITFLLSNKTTEDEWSLIKDKTNEVYKDCNTQKMNVNFFTKNAVIGECFGENDCRMLLNNLTLSEMKPNITFNSFWNDLINLYEKNYNKSSGLGGYIFTNIECNEWTDKEMNSVFESSKKINNAIKKYKIFFNIIQIINEEVSRKCDFTSTLKESSNRLDIITVDNKNLFNVNSTLYGLCYEGYNEYKLESWPQNFKCSSNEDDFKNCKNWTYSFYIALSSSTSNDEVKKLKEFLNKIIKSCNIPGSHVYFWTSKTSIKVMSCDPALKNNCEEAISGLSLYNMIYSNKSLHQLDIKSMKKERSWINNPIGEGVALYIISNLQENEFYGTQFEETFINHSWNQGYFYYTNHIVTRIFDIGKVLEKRNNNKTLVTLKNASNFYFDIVSVDDFDDLLEKSNMTVCKANLLSNNSLLSFKKYSNINFISFFFFYFCFKNLF